LKVPDVVETSEQARQLLDECHDPETYQQPVLQKYIMSPEYREASRAKSNADFISKIEGSLQELEETEYWLELP